MKCINCGNEIDNKMKAAIAKNECPFCAEEIMEAKKLEQLQNLEQVLSSARFTNNDDVNQRIREKVTELLLGHFEFERITPQETESDVIVLDEENEEEEEREDVPKKTKIKLGKKSKEEEELEDVPTRDLKSVRQEAKQAAMAELSPSLYQQVAANEGTADFSSLPNPEDIENLSEEEIAMLMAGQGDPQTQKKVEHLQQLRRTLPKKLDNITPRVSGKGGSSITRRA